MYIGCGDNKGYACDLGSQQVVQVAQVRFCFFLVTHFHSLPSVFEMDHNIYVCLTWFILQHDAPIKVARWVQVGQTPVLATGSWDKTVKYWDTRSPNPIATVPMKGKVYCADFLGNLGVVCTSDRSIYIFDMNNPSKEFKSFQSPLKYQTRTVACSPDKTNFALGSIEGRIAIHYIADNQRGSDFAFKCHRDGTNDKSLVFAINCISWHMQQGTFASGGSDGNYNFWDKDARTRCKSFERMPQPITAVSFSPDGNMFAYAQGYDWSKGAEGFNQNLKPLVHVHGVKLEEVKKKPPNSGGSRR